MAKNVLDFEPRLALFVPNDNPLRFYNRIMDVAIHLLNENAYLFFEINEGFAAAISSLFEEKGFINIELRKDLQGKVRMIKAKKPIFNA
jgi:release factor glutamine methyltransferase